MPGRLPPPIQKSNYDQYTQLFQGPIGGTSFSLQSAECKDADSNGFQSLACNDEYWKRQNFWTAANHDFGRYGDEKRRFFELHWPEKGPYPASDRIDPGRYEGEGGRTNCGTSADSPPAALGAKLDLVPKGQRKPRYRPLQPNRSYSIPPRIP